MGIMEREWKLIYRVCIGAVFWVRDYNKLPKRNYIGGSA